MVILAAAARPPRPRPVLAAGQADRARGPVLPGRGTRAWSAETPHRIARVLIRMVAEPLRVRRARGSHGTPFQQTKGGMRAGSGRAVPLVAVLGPEPSLPGGRTDVNQAGACPDRTRAIPYKVRALMGQFQGKENGHSVGQVAMHPASARIRARSGRPGRARGALR